MTNLPGSLRSRLSAEFLLDPLTPIQSLVSSDGFTRKLAMSLPDGEVIETVWMEYERRRSVCVSTQVGCGMGCAFCATGQGGLRRNLTAGEIVAQALAFARDMHARGERLTNVVFMGMGEPLLNLAAVVEAVRILLHPKAFAMAPRRVTVSTVGVVPKIEPLLRSVPVNLAVSLHAPTDAIRDRLVPVNRRFPLRVLLGALRELDCITKQRPVFFEYALIAGVNDEPAHARRLAPLLRGIPCKLNLIPLNPHEGSPHAPPSEQAIDRFLREVAADGLRVTLRRSRGCDIRAACGQLALHAAGECAA
jgi:23S rRNA (adenine2503-C2)-methyltransferase